MTAAGGDASLPLPSFAHPRRFIMSSEAWPPGAIDPEHVVITEPVRGSSIPVHLMYFTLRVDEDGTIRSYGDVYGHNKKLIELLNAE